MAFYHKVLRKTRTLLPAAVFLAVIYLLYRKIIYHRRLELGVPIAAPEENELPTSPPKHAWAISFTDTDHCIQIATSFTDYNVLLVGHLIVPTPELRHSRCHYLTAEKLKPLQNQQSIIKLHHRTTAFIYAIQHGAEAIYILPSDLDLQQIQSPPDANKKLDFYSLVISSNLVFDPLLHWGCNLSTSIKRPFQISHINYELCKLKPPVIQTQASSIQTDRVERSGNHDRDISCDNNAPSVTLTPDTFAFISNENTFYSKEAFWALPVIQLSHMEEVPVSFLLQKLLWLNGHNVMVLKGNPINRYKTASGLNNNIIKFLMTFRCTSDVVKCAIGLFEEAELKGFISHSTTKSFNSWLNLLKKNNYDFQKVVNDKIIMECRDENIQFFPVNHKVLYSIRKWRPMPFLPVNNVKSIQSLHHSTCSDLKLDTGVKIDFLGPWTQWEDVLLIIVFNDPLYNVIPYTEILYRSFFPNILYCGPGIPDSDLTALKDFGVSFVSYGGTPAGHFPGSFNYECLMMAAHMNYKVKGYLVIADDLLIVPKRLKDLNLGQPWFIPQNEVKTADMKTLRECRLGMCDFHSHWRWWEDYQSAVLNTLSELHSKQSQSQVLKQCVETLTLVNKGKFNVNGAYSDVYYIPSYLIPDFVELAQIFLNNYAFLEITIPTILHCLVPQNEVLPLHGKQIWDESRDQSWVYFTKQEMVYKSYLHPTKWGNVAKQSQEYTQLFCKVVSYLHDPYGRIS